jgi:hypothetical protein
MWGSTARSYQWTDPVPFDLGSKTASVVIHHTRTVAGLERRVTGPQRDGPPAVRPPTDPCVVQYLGRPRPTRAPARAGDGVGMADGDASAPDERS